MNSFLILDAGGLEGLYKYQNSTWSYLDIGIDTVGEQILNGKKAYTNKGLITGSFGL